MSSKNKFKIDDKVFAKVKGHPARPAKVSEVKGADTPSRTKFSVNSYGTGERASCKPKDHYNYEEIKLILGKPNKREYFVEAIAQIEIDFGNNDHPNDNFKFPIKLSNKTTVEVEIPADVIANIIEAERISKTISKSKKKLTIGEPNSSKAKEVGRPKKSLGTKRKLSDIIPDGSAKKSTLTKTRTYRRLNSEVFPSTGLLKGLKDISLKKSGHQASKSEKKKKSIPDGQINETVKPVENEVVAKVVVEKSGIDLDSTIESVKSVQEIKDIPTTTSSETSFSNSSNEGQVSHSKRKIKPKTYYTDYNMGSGLRKRSRMSKGNNQTVGNSDSSITINDQSQEKNSKTKGTSSSSKNKKVSKTLPSVLLPTINVAAAKNRVVNNIKEESKSSAELRDLMVESTENKKKTEKTLARKLHKDELIREVKLLNYIYILRDSLRIDRANYKKSLKALKKLSELEITTLMLKKNSMAVDTILNLTKYVGNTGKWGLNEQELEEHRAKITQVRGMAITIYMKFKSLFNVPDGQKFYDSFNKEVKEFNLKTKHLSFHQILHLTSVKMCE